MNKKLEKELFELSKETISKFGDVIFEHTPQGNNEKDGNKRIKTRKEGYQYFKKYLDVCEGCL
jgi:hypothetical protein